MDAAMRAARGSGKGTAKPQAEATRIAEADPTLLALLRRPPAPARSRDDAGP